VRARSEICSCGIPVEAELGVDFYFMSWIALPILSAGSRRRPRLALLLATRYRGFPSAIRPRLARNVDASESRGETTPLRWAEFTRAGKALPARFPNAFRGVFHGYSRIVSRFISPVFR
jgi:hypothetical protein